jgi:hypothetical protein
MTAPLQVITLSFSRDAGAEDFGALPVAIVPVTDGGPAARPRAAGP